jgi:hypothetical protein
MNKLKCARSLFPTLMVASLGCSEVTGPRPSAILVPSPRLSNASGPPDSTFNIPADRGWPPAQIPLITFPYDTWVTLASPGSVTLNAKPPLPGASTNYVLGGPAPATGIVDNHTDGVCVLNLNVKDNYGNLPSFGQCGAPVKIDTLLTRKNNPVLITRGPTPVKHYYECSTTSDVCHWLNPGDYSTVRERPIPVTLNKLKSSKRTSASSFAAHDSLTFTASKSMDSIYVGGIKPEVPHVITLWQWIGADLTRNPIQPWATNGPCRSVLTLTCQYAPYESGRMVVKAFLGGWEQTNSVTVQCLVYDGDFALNDTTSDFRVRGELLDLLNQGNADSSETAGWDASNPRGWQREAASVTWQLSNGGAFLTIPVDDPNADACHISIPSSAYDASHPPVPGATVYSINHSHPSVPTKEVFCEGWKWTNFRIRRYAGKPADTLNANRIRRVIAKQDSLNGPSPADWDRVDERQRPSFIVQKNGFVYKVNVFGGFNPLHVYRAAKAETESDKRCAWVKKYTP